MALGAVIFDMDGTLLDTNGLHGRAWSQALQDFGHVLGEDRILLEIGKSGDRMVPALLGEAVADEKSQSLRDRHGERYEEMLHALNVRAFPRVKELIAAIHDRGLKVAIATAAKQEHLDATMERSEVNLLELVDEVVTDTDVKDGKPAPDIVLAAVRKLGLSPAECVMVGDTPYDAESALRAGVTCIGVLTGVHDRATLRRAGARAVYADTGDLMDHLDEALHLVSPASIRLTPDKIEELMRAALLEARTGLDQDEFPVGSVLANSTGAIVARAHNEAKERGVLVAHAELLALEQMPSTLAEQGGGLILVTTLEPCVMCYGAAMVAGVDTIVFGLASPLNGGFERVKPFDAENAMAPRVIGGVQPDESADLLRQYLDAHPDDAFTRSLLGE